jgi:hypothetical protein
LENHFVFLDAKLGLFADRQQNRVLFVARPDAINDLIALQYVFLAQQRMGLFVSGICAYNLTYEALSTVFIYTALD